MAGKDNAETPRTQRCAEAAGFEDKRGFIKEGRSDRIGIMAIGDIRGCGWLSGGRLKPSGVREWFGGIRGSLPSAGVRRVARVAICWALAVITAGTTVLAAPGVELRPATNTAFDRYVALTEQRNAQELKTGQHLLWIDSLGQAERAKAYEELKQGSVKMSKLDTLDNGVEIPVPGGMIHHWVGLAFIPGARVDDVLAILQDYNRQSTYYAPDVVQSRIESHDGDHFVVFLRFRRHKVVTVVLDTVHDVRYFRDSLTQAHSRSATTKVSQVDNPGKKDERDRPPGNDDGFMWRMDTWWRVVERDGGVYVQSEVVSLTRDIPTGLGWMVKPFVTSIPQESLEFTMEATRKAVEGRMNRAK